MDDTTKSSDITLADLLAAFSLATDLGLGQPMSHLLRAWQIAVRLAERLRASVDRPALFYVAMLAWVGCVADAPEVAANFGDDIAFRADSYDVDLGGMAALAFFLSHAGAGGSLGQRARSITALLATGGNRVAQGIQGHCLVTSVLAEDLGLGTDVATALRQFFARWDGQGVPRRLGGSDIAVPVRIFHLADVIEVYDRRGGVPGAVREARRRRGRQFDPGMVDVFCASADDILRDVPDVYDASGRIVAEPQLVVPLSNGELDHALTAFADFTDLRCPTRARHSRGVSELAVGAARHMRLTPDETTTLGRAGLVHDIGLHGVPATILMKETVLSASERERLRASSYYTERVLARPPALARIGAVAALAHERVDGTGYHRGLQGSAIPLPGRVLAAACAFAELVAPRMDGPGLRAKEAAARLRAEAMAGRLDPVATDAVLTTAGAGTRRPTPGAAGLTAREVEVLLLIARGAATREVARELGISQKTAGTHIERIYAKTGSHSRSTATIFALKNGLLDALDL
jgi:HD-GYP domain-containing protein (c-di-GMP phosphodiesterase class II)/DNA-binding CsgD family transcriptional regulator